MIQYRIEFAEAYAISGRLMKVLLEFARLPGEEGSVFRNMVGRFLANFYDYVLNATVGTEMMNCFIAATEAGAALKDMEDVRLSAMLETPRHLLGNYIVNSAIIFAFAEQSKIILKTEFKSREQAEMLMDELMIAVDEVKLSRSNSFQSEDYQNYVALSALLFQHLSATVRQLPRIVKRHFALNLPALNLSNRIYGDGSRSDELIAENKTVHPAFMQRDIVVLSE